MTSWNDLAERVLGGEPAGADDAFRQLTTSDTDPFGNHSGSGSLRGMLSRRSEHPEDEDGHDEEEGQNGAGEHDEHEHGSEDPHLWTDPLVIAELVAVHGRRRAGAAAPACARCP